MRDTRSNSELLRHQIEIMEEIIDGLRKQLTLAEEREQGEIEARGYFYCFRCGGLTRHPEHDSHHSEVSEMRWRWPSTTDK